MTTPTSTGPAQEPSDTEMLDWLDARSFTAYRQRDPEYGELHRNAVVVDEDAHGSRCGHVHKTLRESIKAAMSAQRPPATAKGEQS